jgi:hypothetical protein
MALSRTQQTALASTLALGALVLLYRTVFASDGRRAGAFFYDVSAGRLFVAPLGSVPPIRGIDGPEDDAFRAVVISMSGDPADKTSRRIAYLERYSPELKQQMEAAQAGGPPPSIGRSEAQSHRWVRRTNDTDWAPLASEAGERVASEWTATAPGGVTPVVCTP